MALWTRYALLQRLSGVTAPAFVWLLAAALTLGSVALPSHATYAANGSFVHEVTFNRDCSSGIGVGIAYDGAEHLWVSCYASSPDLLRASATTGVVDQTYTIAGDLGALAYDAGLNAIWAAENGNIYFIQLDGSHKVVSHRIAFTPDADAEGLVDGLALDTTDQTLYFKPDNSSPIHHYTTAGKKLADIPGALSCNGPRTSGLAIGGDLLYEGKNGCSHVFVVNKTSLSPAFDFSTVIPSDPNHRDEGLTCDTQTFAGKGAHVMWSKEAYSPNRAAAFEIPFGTCGAGGQHFVQDFKQNDSQWGSQHYWGNSRCFTLTVGGCSLTAVADVAASYNQIPAGFVGPMNPGTLNEFLTHVSNSHSPDCDPIFGNIGPDLGMDTTVLMPGAGAQSWAQRKLEIDQALKLGDLPIVTVYERLSPTKMHFVVLYQGVQSGKTHPDGTPDYSDYYFVDPDGPSTNPDGTGRKLFDSFGLPDSSAPDSHGNSAAMSANYLEVVVFENKSHPGPVWSLRGHSPIQILVTDPNGASTGFNPPTGTIVTDIPKSTYGIEPAAGIDPALIGGALGPGVEDNEYFQVSRPIDGTYFVQVIGTGSGPYSLDFGASTGTAAGTTLVTFRGNASPGSRDTYRVQVTGGSIVVQPVGVASPPSNTAVTVPSPPATGTGSVVAQREAEGGLLQFFVLSLGILLLAAGGVAVRNRRRA